MGRQCILLAGLGGRAEGARAIAASRIHHKGYRTQPPSGRCISKGVDRLLRSRIRVRVEHVFGSMVNEMKRT